MQYLFPTAISTDEHFPDHIIKKIAKDRLLPLKVGYKLQNGNEVRKKHNKLPKAPRKLSITSIKLSKMHPKQNTCLKH